MKIIREYIEFERGKTPQSAMGLGLKGKIDQWLDENYNMDYDQPGALEAILGDSELEKETREAWTKFMLSQGYDWDENELYEMFQQQIDVVGNLPLGEKKFDDVKLINTKEGWEIQFGGWEDFAKYFDGDYEKYLEEVLGGDAWTYFEDSGEYIELSDIIDFIKSNEIDLSDLKKKFIEYGGGDLSDEEMLEIISDDDEFSDLAKSLKYAAGGAQGNSNESAAFNHIKGIIINHFGLSNIEWDTDHVVYDAHITKDGVENLIQCAYLKEKQPKYNEPQYGYMSDWDKESFEMELENQLEGL